VKEEQENLSKVHPRLIYSLVQKIIKDSKRSVGQKDSLGISKLMEKHRIDTLLATLLSKITDENALVTE
jgi:hypothetical protein